MTRVLWDQVGEKVYETGVDRGVLYIPDNTGDYVNGYAWNGLTAVTESPSGAESNKQYADNTVYLNLKSAEEFGGTVEAFTYPEEFGQCDGTAAPTPGVRIGQQVRKTFGLSYRTLIGNDLEGTEYGYKIHLIYGADAAPSERAYGTVNDSPEAITFSWEIMTTPVPVGTINGTEYKPTSYIEIDSTEVDGTALGQLEDLLYGTGGTDPSLPTPAEVVALFAGAVTVVNLNGANAPTYNSGTHVVTLPTVAGVTWRINGVVKTAGAQPALTTGQTAIVTSHLGAGYVYGPSSDSDWTFAY
jgi:hypothetical protein